MAKAKYTRQSNGYFQAYVWDGTYRDGKKHRIVLRSKVSSAALEKLVIEYNNKHLTCISCNSSKSGQIPKITKRLKPLKLLSLSLFSLLRHGGIEPPTP